MGDKWRAQTFAEELFSAAECPAERTLAYKAYALHYLERLEGGGSAIPHGFELPAPDSADETFEGVLETLMYWRALRLQVGGNSRMRLLAAAYVRVKDAEAGL